MHLLKTSSNKLYTTTLCSFLLLIATHSVCSASATDEAEVLSTQIDAKNSLAEQNQPTQIKLAPYHAQYKASMSGLSVNIDRNFEQQANGLWQLSNNASMFLASIEESSNFQIIGRQVKPQSYHYKNSMRSSKNSSLDFDWSHNKVSNSAQKTQALSLARNKAIYDSLSFQTQLRLDLISSEGKLKQQKYQVVDSDRIKTYQVDILGEESISLPSGNFETIKAKQFRPGKDRYTMIWLAKDWQYLIVRFEHFEDKVSDNSIELQEAIFDGKNLSGSSH